MTEHPFPAGVTLRVTDDGWAVEHGGEARTYATWRHARRRINRLQEIHRVPLRDTAAAYEAFEKTHGRDGRPL